MSYKSFFESHLKGVRWGKEGRGMAFCPLHNDKRRSLSVDANRGLWYCHACSIGGTVFDLAKKLGIPVPKQKKESPVGCYVYTNEKGDPIFRILRGENKRFWAERYISPGVWEKGMKEVKPVPYRLHEIVGKSGLIFIVEGEKDVETLRGLGFVATTNPFGAGKWSAEFNEYFSGKDVVLLPDNDPPGIAHMEDVAKNLFPAAKSIKLIPLPGLKEKGDITDWINSGGSEEALMELVDESRYLWSPKKDVDKDVSEAVIETPEELETERVAEKERFPEFPKEAWIGIAGDYLRLVTASTEAPESFHFATITSILGLCLGRKFYFLNPHPVFQNYYFMVVGTSSLYHKGTAVRFGEEVGEGLKEEIKSIQIFVSSEGVFSILAKEPGTRLLVVNDEMRTLFANAHRPGTLNVFSNLCTLYDLKRNLIVGQKNTLEIKDGLFSMISAVTTEWISETGEIEAALGGFLNRNIIVAGKVKGPIHDPIPPSDSERARFLEEVRRWKKELPGDGGVIIKGKGAMDFYRDYYCQWFKDVHRAPGVIGTLRGREAHHVIKLSALFALENTRMEIVREDIERAISVVNHSSVCQSMIFKEIDVSRQGRLENRVIEILSDGPKKKRDICTRMSSYSSYGERVKAIENVYKAGMVEMWVKPNERGRQTEWYYLPQHRLMMEEIIAKTEGGGKE